MARKPYRQPQPATWWLKNPAYRRYMLREATAIPIFLYTLLLMSGVYQLTQGEQAFASWLAMLRQPWAVVLHGVALAATLYHSWTWFQLVPKILIIHTSTWRVDGRWIRLAHQMGALLCFLVTVVLALWLLGAGDH